MGEGEEGGGRGRGEWYASKCAYSVHWIITHLEWVLKS